MCDVDKLIGPFVLHQGDHCIILKDGAYLLRKLLANNSFPLFKMSKKMETIPKIELIHSFPEYPHHVCASSAGISFTFTGVNYFLPSSFESNGLIKIENKYISNHITYGSLSDAGILLLASNDVFIFLSLVCLYSPLITNK